MFALALTHFNTFLGENIRLYGPCMTLEHSYSQLELAACWFLHPEKNPRSKVENQHILSPYDVNSGNRTRVTLVGGECSHYCAIPAPQYAMSESAGGPNPANYPTSATKKLTASGRDYYDNKTLRKKRRTIYCVDMK